VIEYQRKHKKEPANVVNLTYQLSASEVAAVNDGLGVSLIEECAFTLHHNLGNTYSVGLEVPEGPYLAHLLGGSGLSAEVVKSVKGQDSVRGLIENLAAMDLNTEGQTFLQSLRALFKPEGAPEWLKPEGAPEWRNLLELLVWTKHIKPAIPRFFYFDDYYLLPGKVNLAELKRRVATPAQMEDEDQTVVSLLRMAGVSMAELTDQEGYEDIKARLEGLSNSITDKIFKYWKQNQELDVEFDIRPDPTDKPPFNVGPNLYIRIRNRRHRVTVPFSQRSKGFIWFFSFIVWFDTVQQEGEDTPLILLLDEPGLSLHALAQADFLTYIDDLARSHQILYTTHSPFMIHSDRLHQVRLVEDRKAQGTVISDNILGSDAKTVFPLQAALGYTVAQNLFISKRNLLVEGPTDLVYLRFFAATLEAAKRKALREDVTLVPAGGLDKVATFIALLGANQLELAVLHDSVGKPDQRLESLVKQNMIRERQVLNYGMFRNPMGKAKGAAKPPPSTASADVEDLISLPLYLSMFHAAFEKRLGGVEIKESDLPPGDRIVDRINRHLDANGISLRPSGGFNHYAVANFLASNPPKAVDKETLSRFETLFAAVNSLFSVAEEG
jgi:AAA ATPase domain